MILFFVSFAAVLPRGLVTGVFCLLAHAMPLGKRKLDDAAEEWRQELADGFVSGCVSGLRLQRMAAKASRAGAEGGDGIAKAGKSGKLPQNVFRDVNRCLKKRSWFGRTIVSFCHMSGLQNFVRCRILVDW